MLATLTKPDALCASLPARAYALSALQHTLADPVRSLGIGVHAGTPARLELRPAPVGSGITFIRTDQPAGINRIPARWDQVTDTRLCTALTNAHGVGINTVEHLMAALAGCGVDNVDVLVDGPEVPIMDGSAAPFVELVATAGLEPQSAVRRIVRVLKPVRVEDGDKWAALDVADATTFAMTIDFPSPAIGRQTRMFALEPGRFSHDLARARTFGFLHEVEHLQKLGLAKGGSLDNAVVVDGARILNPEGLRYTDEFVRHKLLDSVGDLALAGAPVRGAYSALKGGHALNNRLLHALFADPANWDLVAAG